MFVAVDSDDGRICDVIDGRGAFMKLGMAGGKGGGRGGVEVDGWKWGGRRGSADGGLIEGTERGGRFKASILHGAVKR